MNVTQKNNQKGFTIIEVVLVLAIAALIFLMVFIALPALQRSQRDTQRKSDVSRLQTAIQNAQSSNRNQIPTLDSAFIDSYMKVGGEEFNDPDGTPYKFEANADNGYTPTTFVAGKLIYTLKAKCEGEKVVTGQGAAKVAVQYKLEGGGTTCVNN